MQLFSYDAFILVLNCLLESFCSTVEKVSTQDRAMYLKLCFVTLLGSHAKQSKVKPYVQ